MNAAAMECHHVVGGEAERRYLEALNVCFPAWGGREMFDWCFTRESAGLRPDLMTLHADSGPVAGSANTYRRIQLPNGQTLVAGIMTGSWTLPEARGLGAFTRLIEESRERAAARHAGLLLAFVTCTNASASRLRAAGAALFPTWYCRSPEKRQVDARDEMAGDVESGPAAARDDGLEYREDGAGNTVRFVYTSNEWRDQFILRPTSIMRVRRVTKNLASATNAATKADRISRWNALVERTPQFDRVLALTRSVPAGPEELECADADAIAALDAHAAVANRRLFCFTSEPLQASRLRERGFEIVDGYITALIANASILRSACTARSDALSSMALADPTSPWYLGGWSVRNGDRM